MKNMNNEFSKFVRSNTSARMTAVYDYQSKMNQIITPMASYISPTIIEERQMNMTQMDVFSRLMVDNIIFLGTAINDDVANIINAQLLFLQSVDPSKDVNMYINSPGGGVYAGLSILDTMDLISNKTNTVTCGMAASMGFILAISGDERKALKHSRFLLHQPLGGAQGQESDIQIVAREIGKLKSELYQIVSERTKQPIEKVTKDGDRDYWMTSAEALEYGAIDEILIKEKK